jgi:hypothetical protein
MSDSTSLIDALAASSSNLPLRINELFDSVSTAMLGARRAGTTTGLTWGYYGGKLLINGVPTAIASGTKTLTGSATNYITLSRAGTVSVGASAPVGDMLLYTIVAGASTVTSYTDNRTQKSFDRLSTGIATQAMADANQTLTQAQAMCDVLKTTGALTGTRNLVVPLTQRQWSVRNTCTGGSIQVIGSSGTGVTIATGKAAIVVCDGTNVDRVTADA